ncbi:MAG: lytic transglycosylase domain-containing protein [Ferruginibacter sp.]
MKLKLIINRILVCLILLCMYANTFAHDIYFCGEKIPIDDKTITDKLMNIIKSQIRYVDIVALRKSPYMPQVEKWLRATNLPQDFKYLAIVESGFKKDITSGAGARGFWQLMPETARERNLVVNEYVDERIDFDKSTYAACQELARNYLSIRKTYGISSWVLAAAAYNVGLGRIKNAISLQGHNYFTMKLNPETAAYVYKIIAVKELFEFPELYMKDFGYNVFNEKPPAQTKISNDPADTDVSIFNSMKVDVNESDGQHPVDLKEKINTTNLNGVIKIKFIPAKIKGNYNNIKDGDIVSFKLDNDLQVQNRFTAKGSIIQGRAWIIDDRAMIDMGYGHSITLNDLVNEKGIGLSRLKNKQPVIIRVMENKDYL